MIYSDAEIRGALAQLNGVYAAAEASAPAKGYRVVFLERPRLEGSLIPAGGSRSTPHLLSGIPQDEASYRTNQCVFCKSAAKVEKVFKEGNRAVLSLSNQVLIIPKKHYAHWFDIPLEEQIELFKEAMEIRDANPSSVSHPIELHCGSAAGQTVFHTHVRTGVFRK